jgi:peptidoglycan/LPS O-acetylase OafA/YrhL
VLMVVGFHAFNWPRNGGTIGVGTFFVLSGFLITTLLLVELERTGGLRLGAFYARRSLRLFPLLYLALVVIALSVPFMVSPAERAHNLSSLAYCAAYAGDLYGFLSRANGLAGATAHLWSLAVEEQFYLLWPAVVLVVVRRRGERAVLSVAVAGMAAAVVIRVGFFAAGKVVWSLPTTHADALLAGCGLAVLARRGALRSLTDRTALQWAGLAALVVSLSLSTLLTTTRAGAGYLVVESIGVVLLLCALAPSGPIRTMLNTRPLVYCGRVSYGVYVIHSIVFLAIVRNVSHGDIGWPWALLSIAVTFVLAAASRRWYEGYFMRIKDRRFGHTGDPERSPLPA